MLIDVAAHLVRSSSSSFAKNTEADFKISFARRSSKFSARSRRISSRSWLVGNPAACRSRLRAGGCACATSRGASRDQPRCARSAARSPSASRMPRCTSSSGYFFGRGMRTGGSPSARTHPGFRASVEPSLAHTVRSSGETPHAKLNTGSQAPGQASASRATPASSPLFTRPCESAKRTSQLNAAPVDAAGGDWVVWEGRCVGGLRWRPRQE